MLIWAIVGGTATFYGPILGVVVLTILNEVVLRALGVDEMRPMFYGAILILFILFLPKGLESLVPKLRGWFAGGKSKREGTRAACGSRTAGGIGPGASSCQAPSSSRSGEGASRRQVAAISLRVSLSSAGRSRRHRAKASAALPAKIAGRGPESCEPLLRLFGHLPPA